MKPLKKIEWEYFLPFSFSLFANFIGFPAKKKKIPRFSRRFSCPLSLCVCVFLIFTVSGDQSPVLMDEIGSKLGTLKAKPEKLGFSLPILYLFHNLPMRFTVIFFFSFKKGNGMKRGERRIKREWRKNLVRLHRHTVHEYTSKVHKF